MNNIIVIFISLLIVSLFGCIDKYPEEKNDTRDYEMEVLNDILPNLIPEDYPCKVMPAKGNNESQTEFEARLKEYNNSKDSIGRKVLIRSHLEKMDSSFFSDHFRPEKLLQSIYIIGLPMKDREIDSSMIHHIDNVNIKVSNSEPFDCFTLGVFTFSRVGFNHDHTIATFHYSIYDGSCFIEHVVVKAKYKNGKWQIIKRNTC